MVQETRLSVTDFILPLFVTEGKNIRSEVKSMPGIYRFSPDLLLQEVQECVDLGVRTFAPFPNLPESLKDKYATESHNHLHADLVAVFSQYEPLRLHSFATVGSDDAQGETRAGDG